MAILVPLALAFPDYVPGKWDIAATLVRANALLAKRLIVDINAGESPPRSDIEAVVKIGEEYPDHF